MKLLLVTDAWAPQVNGVVRTLSEIRHGLEQRGWEVEVLGPSGFTIPCPTYPEIRLTVSPKTAVIDALEQNFPDAIHIATEGPLGHAMRTICLLNDWPFTTSFHTRFPEYLKARMGLPRRWTYAYLRRFHRPAQRILVPTPSLKDDLVARGFGQVEVWGRGVDLNLFRPERKQALPFHGPIQLYVGRLAIEKNIEAFLDLHTPGTKVVVGDGPAKVRLQARYPEAVFMGAVFGEKLATIYASADVLVFPSRTDTFGLVMLEALASGLPVAAFPVTGPKDLITDPRVGILDEDLQRAVERALLLNREDCRRFAESHSWENSIEVFARGLVPGVTRYQGGFSPNSASGLRFNWTNRLHSLDR